MNSLLWSNDVLYWACIFFFIVFIIDRISSVYISRSFKKFSESYKSIVDLAKDAEGLKLAQTSIESVKDCQESLKRFVSELRRLNELQESQQELIKRAIESNESLVVKNRELIEFLNQK